MAIYHLSVKTISRGQGRSATAAIAYRAGVEIADRRTGEVHDYTRKRGVEHTEIVIPVDAPEWARDRAELWNRAEEAERRKDARIAREYEFALPWELTAAQRRELAVGFARELVERYGVAADVAIHAPHRQGDQRNYHAHLLTTTRKLDAEGLGEKAEIELSDGKLRKQGRAVGREQVERIRQVWERYVNQTLERAGIEARVDHRSLEAQGIERAPTVHLGPKQTQLERLGIATRQGEVNRERRQINAQMIGLSQYRRRMEAETEREAQEAPEKAKATLATPTAGKGPRKPVEARSAPGATPPPASPPKAAPGPPGGPQKASAGSAYDRILALAERNARKEARKAQETPEKGKATLATPTAGKGPRRPPEAARDAQAPDLPLPPAGPSQTAPGPPGGPQRQEWPAVEVAKVVRRQSQDLEQEAAQQAKTLERVVEIVGMTPEQVRAQARTQVGGQRLEAAQQTHAQAMEQIAKLRYLFEIYNARWSQAGLGQRWNPWSSLNREGQDLERARKAALVGEAKARKELAAVDVWLEQPAQRQAIEARYRELVGMIRQLREELPAQRQAIEAKRAAAALGREREKNLWTLGGRLVAVDRQRGEDGREDLAVDWGKVKRQAEQVRQQQREQWERRRGRDRSGPKR